MKNNLNHAQSGTKKEGTERKGYWKKENAMIMYVDKIAH